MLRRHPACTVPGPTGSRRLSIPRDRTGRGTRRSGVAPDDAADVLQAARMIEAMLRTYDNFDRRKASSSDPPSSGATTQRTSRSGGGVGSAEQPRLVPACLVGPLRPAPGTRPTVPTPLPRVARRPGHSEPFRAVPHR